MINFKKIASNIKKHIKEEFRNIEKHASSKASKIKDVLHDASQIKDIIEDSYDKVQDNASSKVSKIKDVLRRDASQIKEILEGSYNKAQDNVSSKIFEIKDELKNELRHELRNILKDEGEALIKEILKEEGDVLREILKDEKGILKNILRKEGRALLKDVLKSEINALKDELAHIIINTYHDTQEYIVKYHNVVGAINHSFASNSSEYFSYALNVLAKVTSIIDYSMFGVRLFDIIKDGYTAYQDERYEDMNDAILSCTYNVLFFAGTRFIFPGAFARSFFLAKTADAMGFHVSEKLNDAYELIYCKAADSIDYITQFAGHSFEVSSCNEYKEIEEYNADKYCDMNSCDDSIVA